MPPASSTAFCGDRGVDDHRFDRAGLERVDRVGAFRVGPEFAGVGFFLRRVPSPVVPCWAPTILPGEVVEAGRCRCLLDQDRLFGEVVRVGEVDGLLAFRRDRRRRDRPLSNLPWPTSRKIVSNEVSWNSGVAADLFGDRFHQFDVEAGVVARFALLERGIGDVGADRQRFAAPLRRCRVAGRRVSPVLELLLSLLPQPATNDRDGAHKQDREQSGRAGSCCIKRASDQEVAGRGEQYSRSTTDPSAAVRRGPEAPLHFLK